MFDSFEKSKNSKRRKLFCNDCGIRTIHSPVASRTGAWSDPVEPINGAATFSMYQCGGCDTVCYLTVMWDSECYDIDLDGEFYAVETVKQYPPPLENGFTFNKTHTPGKLDELLGELVSGFLQANYVSATLLTRVVIEYLVKDAKCSGRNLKNKIHDLKEKGLVDQDQHDLLQEIRNQGNKGAHEAVGLSSDALRSAFEIVALLVDQLYNHHARTVAAVRSAKRHFSLPINSEAP